VIAGSHGKTTITAMVLHALHTAGLQPDYMVGASLEGFEVMVKVSEEAHIAVLEGDEYLSSPLDPRPKFLHYAPHIALISGIAWDHINVFPTEQEYLEQFVSLMEHIEPGGSVVYCEEDETLRELVAQGPEHIHYIPYRTPVYTIEKGKTTLFADADPGNQEGSTMPSSIYRHFPLQIFGKHNLQNLAGAMQVCQLLGLAPLDFLNSMTTFKGAARRLEKVASKDESVVYRDFAHAPSKLKATVAAAREQYPDHSIQACIELHTFSSLSAQFLPQYFQALDAADEALVFYHPETLRQKKMAPISPEEVRTAFGRTDIHIAQTNTEVQDWLKTRNAQKSCLLLMSSGSFHELDILSLLKEKDYELL
jgi:UDP-N-acetylmuramate: L-alanyl-gamma-D-glutamyl-meso-diaminopimelate ligase